MAYTRATTIDASPTGDTAKQAVLDLDEDLTGAFAALNTIEGTVNATMAAAEESALSSGRRTALIFG